MRGRPALAFCTLGLCLTGPAGAQGYEGGATARALSSDIRVTADRMPALASAGPSVRFGNDTILRHDGTPGDRRSIVGSLPLGGLIAAELGLFSVTGAATSEREFKRTDPIRDVQPRRSRVAAVGLRMNF